MTAPALSPEAQQAFDELLRPVFLDGGDVLQNYYAMLERLASEEVADPDGVKINDMPHAEWKAKRQEIRVARELQQHAAAILRADAAAAAAVAKLPAQAPLDDFLARLMPNTGGTVRRERFKVFLTHLAEMEVDDQMKLHPRSLTREESVDQMVLVRLVNLEHAGLCAELQHMFIEDFRRWWKSQDDGNPFGKRNGTKKGDVAKRHADLVELLPSKPDKPGISGEDWEDQAEKKGLVQSGRTFRRDVAAMVKNGIATKQENGRYRMAKK